MTFTCFAAALLEAGAVSGREIWLAILLNVVSMVAVIALIAAIGPKRLFSGAIKSYRAQKRAKALRALQLITEREALEMTPGEFAKYSSVVKLRLARNFPEVPLFNEILEKLGSGKKKFNDSDIMLAAKEWAEDPLKALETYADIGTWDVMDVTDMTGLFKKAR